MKLFLRLILVAVVAVSCSDRRPVANVIEDDQKAAALKSVELGGYVGDKMGKFFEERIQSKFAKDTLFQEAEDAIRNRLDDSLYAPVGVWQGEFWGKLMISACRVADYTQDQSLVDYLHDRCLRLIALQEPDGYLGSYANKTFIQSPDPEAALKVMGWHCNWCWNLWCRKYTMWGLLACYDLTGDKVLLDAVVKSMDQEIKMLDELGINIAETGTFVGMPSSSVLKPLLILYKHTGYKRYLDFADRIVANWDRDEDVSPNLIRNAFNGKPVHEWYPDPQKWAKAYEMMSCLDGLLEYYRVTGNERVLSAVVNLQDLLWKNERNPLQSVGYNDQFAGAAYHLNGITEPCDAIHWIRLNHDLFLITGDPKYVDVIEYTFYNAFLAGVFRDGKWGARGVRSHCRSMVSGGQVQIKYSHCCVNNMPRCFMDVAQTSVTTDKQGRISVNWYSDNTVDLGDTGRIVVSGNYPVSDKVNVSFDLQKPSKVRFRIPAWSKSVSVNGQNAGSGPWYEMDIQGKQDVEITFDMTPVVVDSGNLPVDEYPKKDYRKDRFARASEGDPDVADRIRLTPAAMVMRGPLVLSRSFLVDDSREEMFSDFTINCKGYSASVEPVSGYDVWGQWELTLKSPDGKTIRTKVCDVNSAADCWYKEGADAYSIWF